MQRDTLLLWGKTQLSAFTDTAYLEAMYLLCFVLKCSQADLLTHPNAIVTKEEENIFRALIQRRCKGEPIAYLRGECEFWSHTFKVTPACLIPRFETELLVEKVLVSYPPHETIRVLDLGTGSGVIAVSLSLERPNWQVVATDRSQKALEIAQENAKRLNAKVTFKKGNWFEALQKEERFHAIISNPPYLKDKDPHLQTSLRYEPQSALVGGLKGDEMLEFLIKNAPSYLLTQGRLWLEQGYDQKDQIYAYFKQNGYTDIQQYKDIAGISRITSGTLKKESM